MNEMKFFYIIYIKKLIVKIKRKLFPVGDIQIKVVSRKFGSDRGTPIDRVYIKNFIGSYKNLFVGNCLEVGYPEYLLNFSVPINQITVLGVNNPDKRFDFLSCDLSQRIKLQSKKYNIFICTQTFNFIKDYSTAIQNSAKLLKEDGAMIGTVSGLSALSKFDDDRWGDYYRFSPRAIREALNKSFNEVEIVVYGNLYSAIHYLAGHSYEDLQNKNLIDKSDELYPIIIGFYARRPKN
jgi:hypothetical protein